MSCSDQTRKLTALICWGFSALGALWTFGFCWLLRDGLKPGMIESHGLLAWQHWWASGGWPGVLVVGVPLVTGLCFWPWRVNRIA